MSDYFAPLAPPPLPPGMDDDDDSSEVSAFMPAADSSNFEAGSSPTLEESYIPPSVGVKRQRWDEEETVSKRSVRAVPGSGVGEKAYIRTPRGLENAAPVAVGGDDGFRALKSLRTRWNSKRVKEEPVAEEKLQEIISKVETTLGYEFRNKALLVEALRHKSYASVSGLRSNQRLEFLGDSVVGLVMAQYAFLEFHDADEGDMHIMKREHTCEGALADVARNMRLGEVLLVSAHERHIGATLDNNKTLCDVCEALFGAIYIDCNHDLQLCHKLLISFLPPTLKSVDGKPAQLTSINSKGLLQNLCQSEWGLTPKYQVECREGPPHNPLFTVSVSCNGITLGVGKARKRQDAEKKAADLGHTWLTSKFPKIGSNKDLLGPKKKKSGITSEVTLAEMRNIVKTELKSKLETKEEPPSEEV